MAAEHLQKYMQYVCKEINVLSVFLGKIRKIFQYDLRLRYYPGASCSKLTLSLVNVSLKVSSLNMAYMLIFLQKKM